jgi:hypothetical protein
MHNLSGGIWFSWVTGIYIIGRCVPELLKIFRISPISLASRLKVPYNRISAIEPGFSAQHLLYYQRAATRLSSPKSSGAANIIMK